MPLTTYQATLTRLLSANRTPDSYLAGGAALHLEPNTTRYSNDLDFFNDSVERVATAFAEDSETLAQAAYELDVDIRQPGYIRAVVSKGGENTKVEWAHDSAWRFLPTISSEQVGYQLHPIDLATNKVLALASRAEPRDFLDVLYSMDTILPLGALCWAAAGKDPGFTPLSLLALLRRRSKYQPEDFHRLHLATEIDLRALKTKWLSALDEAEAFIRGRPPEEMGCLYYSPAGERFVQPGDGAGGSDAVPHFGRPGGVLPRILAAQPDG